ncbi:hypothetical protein GGR50DRAFT_662438 [Xylaria sp. CBS 124048]|nr:hypothetical protein GGR50DRAFT_662438 [Xylaria sp. CBS 124048]
MQLAILKAAALAAVLQATSASPILPIARGRHNVLATTKTNDGQILDWIVPESQIGGSKIATPPPPPKNNAITSHHTRAALQARVAGDPGRQGPNGTVPVLRADGSRKPTESNKKLPTKEILAAIPKVDSAPASNEGAHWYASSGQRITNHGGKGTFSLFKAFTEHDADFSLLQTAVIKQKPIEQTVEAGWINFPNQIAKPHLFSFYTTNGYTRNGDNIGGWNTETTGWVQVDSELYPGVSFSPLSADGGSQYELEIGYYLSEGNWWLWCLDRFIGYYPGSLFSASVAEADSLADHSDLIDWYGEVFNSGPALTKTDMGSGEFPKAGFGKSAYIHNILYVDANNTYVEYNGSDNVIISDSSRYNMQASWGSATTWGSYFYVGGPGAGGKTGA